MSEPCATVYKVCGNEEELLRFRNFIIGLRDSTEETLNNSVFIEDWDRGNCEAIPRLIRWHENELDIKDAPVATGKPKVLTITLETRNSPDHDFIDSAIMTTVGYRLRYYYESSCLGCGDYRTNDENGIFFDFRVEWDCMGHQESFRTVQEAIEYAEEMFGRKFTSIEEVNEFSCRRSDWDSIYDGEEYDEAYDDGEGYDALIEYGIEPTYNDEILDEIEEEAYLEKAEAIRKRVLELLDAPWFVKWVDETPSSKETYLSVRNMFLTGEMKGCRHLAYPVECLLNAYLWNRLGIVDAIGLTEEYTAEQLLRDLDVDALKERE